MFKESFKIPESLEVRQETPEIIYEDKLNDLEERRREEFNILTEVGKEIPSEKNAEKRFKKANKLTAFALTTFIALGLAQESIQNRAFTQITAEKETTQVLQKINIEDLEKQRLKDFQKLKEIIQREKIEEKVEFLRKRYGEVMESFLYNNGISQTLEIFQKVKTGMEQKDPDILIKKTSPTAMTPGSILSNYYLKEKWTPLIKEQKLEKAGKNIEIINFEDPSVFSNETLKKTLESLPTIWFKSSVKSISYNPEIKSDRVGSMTPFGLSALMENDKRAPIEIFNREGGHSRMSILRVISHEIAHANDWLNSQVLSSQERINFLSETTQIYNNKNSYRSANIEQVENEDKFLESYIKVSEYWAEIAEKYISKDEEFKKNYPEDFKLAEKWFNQINSIEKTK